MRNHKVLILKSLSDNQSSEKIYDFFLSEKFRIFVLLKFALKSNRS